MFLMALGVCAIIVVVAVVVIAVTFNVRPGLGQGTLETAQTEMYGVQTALQADMAANNVSSVTADTISHLDNNKTVYYPETAYQPSGSFQLELYLHLPTHGTWTWDSNGTIISGAFTGGGKTCIYYYYALSPWACTES